MKLVGTTANSITTLSFARYYRRNKHDLHECYNQLRHSSGDGALQTEPVRLGCSLAAELGDAGTRSQVWIAGTCAKQLDARK